MMFAVGTLLVSSLALMTPWLQVLSNYPVETAGLVMAPRGLGNLATITLSGRLSTRVDARLLVGAGLLMICFSFWLMTGWTPGCVGARDHRRDRHPGRRHGAGVHAAAGAGVRHVAAGDAHRGRVAVQPAAQHRRGDRRVGDLVAAGAQFAGAARDDRRVGHAVQSRAAVLGRWSASSGSIRRRGAGRRCWTAWSISRRRSSRMSTITCC